MNANQLFEAVGELDPEQILHSEEPRSAARPRGIRLAGLIAAAVVLLVSTALAANAATDGAIFAALEPKPRVWINGEAVEEDDERVAVSSGEDDWQIAIDNPSGDNLEVVTALGGGDAEMLSIYYYHVSEAGQVLAWSMSKNYVEEADGRILLYYMDHEIDLTEQLKDSRGCQVDYTVERMGGHDTHLLITVTRNADGTFSIASEPAG